MKRIFFSVPVVSIFRALPLFPAVYLFLAVPLLMAGCAGTDNVQGTKADNITISYGVSSYAMFGAEQAVIDDLLSRFSSLSFEKTTDELDFGSAFYVTFSYKKNSVRNFWVDRNGVFRINGQCCKVSSGSFDYEHLKAVYEGSKKRPG